MTPFPRTVLVEVQRGFARRMVRVLALVFVGGFLLGAFLNFRADSNAPPVDEGFAVVVEGGQDPSPFTLDLVEFWPSDEFEPILALAAVPLVMAGLVIGASLVGAEWRAGTITTALTWEPRRVRLAAAKFLGAGIVAFLFSVVLQGVFVAVLLPNIATNGSFDGADADWFLGFAEGIARGGALAALASMTAAMLAMIGRNTTVAIAAGFVIVSIAEPIVRAWKPWSDRWLLTTNAGRLYLNDGTPLSDGSYMASGRPAVVTAFYLTALAAVALTLFAKRDVASTG